MKLSVWRGDGKQLGGGCVPPLMKSASTERDVRSEREQNHIRHSRSMQRNVRNRIVELRTPAVEP